jgi:hypothetical protein
LDDTAKIPAQAFETPPLLFGQTRGAARLGGSDTLGCCPGARSFTRTHDRVQVTSDALPAVVRSFDSYSAAATEAGLSRIYGGIHTRLDHTSGLKLGRDVADFVLRQARSRRFGLRRG